MSVIFFRGSQSALPQQHRSLSSSCLRYLSLFVSSLWLVGAFLMELFKNVSGLTLRSRELDINRILASPKPLGPTKPTRTSLRTPLVYSYVLRVVHVLANEIGSCQTTTSRKSLMLKLNQIFCLIPLTRSQYQKHPRRHPRDFAQRNHLIRDALRCESMNKASSRSLVKNTQILNDA